MSRKDTHAEYTQGLTQEDTSIRVSQDESPEGSRDVSPQASPRPKRRKRQAPSTHRSRAIFFRHRSIRERRLSQRARDLIEGDMVIDTEENLFVRHFGKRGAYTGNIAGSSKAKIYGQFHGNGITIHNVF